MCIRMLMLSCLGLVLLISSVCVVPAFADDGAVQVTTDPGSDISPSWSPDGNHIAIGSDRGGNHDIWVIPATGGTATQITTDQSRDDNPDWSPDGSQIAFWSERSGNEDIWVIGGAPTATSESTWGGIKAMFR